MIDFLNKDMALTPLLIDHDPDISYYSSTRKWQGTTALDQTTDGTNTRLWCAIMAGEDEMVYTYVALHRSDDDGRTWSEPVLVVDGHNEGLRIFDQTVWTDPFSRLWLFWSQQYGYGDGDGRVGVWYIRCDHPLAATPIWTKATRIANGVMRNKPTVLSDGSWLLPIALWKDRMSRALNDLPEEAFSNVYRSIDGGAHFSFLGRADLPNRDADEHMIVQLRNGGLWMLIRAKYGIGQAFSHDGGRTWGECGDSGIWGPVSRFFIRRLQSGNLLLVNHVRDTDEPRESKRRANLTAMISKDDGATWEGGLLLDAREEVSYPDGFQRADGRIFIAYDRERRQAKEILLASFTEDEALSCIVSQPDSFLRRVIIKCCEMDDVHVYSAE